MNWIYALTVLCFLPRIAAQNTTEAGTITDISTTTVTSATVKQQTNTTTSTTTRDGFEVKTVTKAPTTPSPKRYTASACEGIEVRCENRLTVYIDKVWNGRKANESCTSSLPECCKSTSDPSMECLTPNSIILDTQRSTCLGNPGQPCLIFPHSSHRMSCNNKLLNSHFTLIEFHCANIPIPSTTQPSTVSTVSTMLTMSNISTVTTPTVNKPTTNAALSTTDKPLPIAIIAGAAGGGVALILLIILIVCCARRSHQRKMKQDMTKPDLGVNPVSEIGVNYVDEQNGTSDPDIIKTTPRTTDGKDYTHFPVSRIQ